MAITAIPPELIVDIFSRLPVKSLCRFKCLSKSFLALISHPKFVNMHLSQTTTQKFLNYHSLSRSLYSIDYQESYHHDEVVAVKLNFPKKNKRRSRWVSIYGSCNGLVLLRSLPEPYGMHIYNPATREYKQIPDDHFGIQHTCTCYTCLYGIGYAQPIEDYKVVKFCKCEENIVYVFSLRNNFWKGVSIGHDISYSYTYNEAGICLNGAIHWLFYDEGKCKVVAFDLMEEKFKSLPLPRDIPLNFKCSIGVLGGCLLFIETSPDYYEEENYFWIMKKYNIIESWAAIPMGEDNDFSCLRALCYLKINSEIIAALIDKKLVFYNPRDDTIKELSSRKISYIYPYWPDIYQESLVSPNITSNHFTDQGLLGFW